MADLKNLVPGPIVEFPVDSWNRHNRATDLVERGTVGLLSANSIGTGHPRSWIPLRGQVAGTLDAAATVFYPVGLGDLIDFIENAADDPVIELHPPEAGRQTAILQHQMGADIWTLAVGGACWAMVNVQSANPTTAGVMDGEAPLVSGGQGFDVLYAPSGTGLKQCFVRFQSAAGTWRGIVSTAIEARDGLTPGQGVVAVYARNSSGVMAATGESRTIWNVHQTGVETDIWVQADGLDYLISVDCDPTA